MSHYTFAALGETDRDSTTEQEPQSSYFMELSVSTIILKKDAL